MNCKQLLLFSAIAIVLIISGAGCANIVPPMGGPRDSLPPVLISANPKDSMLNFTGNRINFVFNEYVEVQNIQENLTVSPTPKVNPVIEYKLRTVTVKIKDTLEKNTTYAIDFGNALRDINEGNVLKDFTYVFSTGATLDSSTFSGRVIVAETGRPDSTLVALLHRSGDDSAVVKERPRYYTKLDSSGHFRFRFLAPGTYYLYALKDEGGAKRYTSKSQLFAFAEAPVVIGGNASPVTLYAYTELEEEDKKRTPVQRTTQTKPKKEEDKRLKFQVNLENGFQDLLGDFKITFNDPLKTFDSTKLVFTDAKFTPIPNYSLTRDTTNTILTLKHTWKENTEYNLILDKDFASDSLDRKLLKTDTIKFTTKKQSDYGSIRLRFPSVDLSKNPVLLLVQNEKVIFSAPLTSKEFFTRLFNPGEYDMRILYDANSNGKWDPGSFFEKRRQPERVEHINKKLTVKPNWDNEMTVTLTPAT